MFFLVVPNFSSVTTMESLFDNCYCFKSSNLTSWDVGNVRNMKAMFNRASAFSSELGSWDVKNVGNMEATFKDAYSFTSTLDNWNVTSVANMDSLFDSASSFTSDLTDWCVEKIPTEPEHFATDSLLDTSAYPDWGKLC